MTEQDNTRQGQIAGGLIIAATLGSLVFMLHHPTSVAGPDDGMLMRDWGIGPVHAGMLICLVALLLALLCCYPLSLAVPPAWAWENGVIEDGDVIVLGIGLAWAFAVWLRGANPAATAS